MRVYWIGVSLICVLGGMIIWHFGWTLLGLLALIFTGILIVLSLIDWRYQCLPDILTLSLLWLGLVINRYSLFVSLDQAVLGALIGYMALGIVAQLFYRLTGKVGMGRGDWKLFAALGAWFGWQELPWIMAAASLSGLIFFLVLIKMRRCTKNDPIPFGPFLAIFGWVALWV